MAQRRENHLKEQKRNQQQAELRATTHFFLQVKRKISETDFETAVENPTKKKHSPDKNILSKLKKQFR